MLSALSQAHSVVKLIGVVAPAAGGVSLSAKLKSAGALLSPVAIKLQPDTNGRLPELPKLDDGIATALVVLCRFTVVACAALTQKPSPALIEESTSYPLPWA